MRIKIQTSVALVFLAIVLTMALVTMALDSSSVFGQLIREFEIFNMPDPGLHAERIQEFMRAYHVRPIGYSCLALVILLIVLGFVTGKSRLSSAGAIVFFLPIFGYFSMSMFFLAGLGILRALWLPFWPDLIRLGDIAYLPAMIIVYPFAFARMRDAGMVLAFLLIALGFLVFVSGVHTWLYGKVQGRGTIDLWLYRVSRHPQYLGWIVWSYGLMLLAFQAPTARGGGNPGASLPWVISSLIIVCVALGEEIKMRRERGEEYEAYRGTVPFMLPLPKPVCAAITAPLRFLLKKDQPENRKELVVTFVVYLAIIMLLSLPFVFLPGLRGWAYWLSPWWLR